jgi:hypothetical protein
MSRHATVAREPAMLIAQLKSRRASLQEQARVLSTDRTCDQQSGYRASVHAAVIALLTSTHAELVPRLASYSRWLADPQRAR